MDNVNKGLDLFSRVKRDPVFAKRVKTLRIHWAYEEGDILDLMLSEYSLMEFVFIIDGVYLGLFREALPFFTALKEFEWIGYPELRENDVQAVLESQPDLQSLGLM